jgi:hypothetical protein
MPDTTTKQQGAGTNKANSISKKEAVRLALKALGRDAKPAQLQPYIKSTFGIDMTPGHITTAKGEFLRKGKKKAAPKPQSQPAPQPPAPQTVKPAGSRSGIALEDIQAVKALIGRLGPENLRTLIQLLSR